MESDRKSKGEMSDQGDRGDDIANDIADDIANDIANDIATGKRKAKRAENAVRASGEKPTDPLSVTFAALADPTRRAILARLAAGEMSVTELAEPFAMSLPAISKHLKVLERAGLIERRRDAQWRPARLDAGPLRDVADWVEAYRRFWEQRFDRLDEYLRSLQAAQKESDAQRDSAAPAPDEQ
jgi:DNA-binding transcriptional ArsR family regulator